MKQPNIVIINYGIGNTFSILSAIKALDYRKVIISNSPKDIVEANYLILPGVGAFASCIENLKKSKLPKILDDVVKNKSTPILGICVGMQVMAEYSEENGIHKGLGWIPGKVIKIKSQNKLKVPHVGWNEISFAQDHKLFDNIKNNSHYYFDHSYHYSCSKEYNLASFKYPTELSAIIKKNNIIGVQFHPEKSSNNGLRLLRNFLSL
ncbi:imidazole glycerol phosphate synthase subunit HisH [bacterium]|nr:imidazole glycerol phosphate synthase subunit HisH [bacterium]